MRMSHRHEDAWDSGVSDHLGKRFGNAGALDEGCQRAAERGDEHRAGAVGHRLGDPGVAHVLTLSPALDLRKDGEQAADDEHGERRADETHDLGKRRTGHEHVRRGLADDEQYGDDDGHDGGKAAHLDLREAIILLQEVLIERDMNVFQRGGVQHAGNQAGDGDGGEDAPGDPLRRAADRGRPRPPRDRAWAAQGSW